VIPASYHRRFEEALPNVVSSVVVTDSGHLVEWERPGDVARVVEAAFEDGLVRTD
jgi:pimeloyl-ACP methyl ester carboxylesterase